MGSTSLPLPTKEQCYALSDKQCREIQEYRDPKGARANRDWELDYQPELVRHYMNMLSFKQVEDIMKPRLEWSYKTYQNRYRDWKFPLDRFEREHVVRDLFGWITSQEDYNPSPSSGESLVQSKLPIRHIQPGPPPIQTQPQVIPRDFFLPAHMHREVYRTQPENRLSISTIASGSTQSSGFYDDTFSSHRASIATTNSSISSVSQYAAFSSRPIQLPKHDPSAGIWNNVLRVIPCKLNHSRWFWDDPFDPCGVCGFSRWHSLMLHARNVGSENFIAAMMIIRDIPRIDYAGNYPMHYLMSAGVGIEYFQCIFQTKDNFHQNVFGQNPLHALNPLGLQDQLIDFLEWLRQRDEPPGVFTQRDIKCRTPLHTMLHHPLAKDLYGKILDIFPFAELQLCALDTNGRNPIRMMNDAATKLKGKSMVNYEKIQAGIAEIRARTHNLTPRYGFHDIARGRRGLTYFGHFQCSICNQSNVHSNSYWEQMICACANGRDRYGPDEMGMTPAHAFVTLARYNEEEQTAETPAQTARLFKFLIPTDDPRLSEALHALDPEGNSLIYNVATRGLDEILIYIIELEHPSRRRAAVNFCTRDSEGNECSVVDAVHNKIQDTSRELHIAEITHNLPRKQAVIDQGKRLLNCRTILRRAGGESKPGPATRWRIAFDSVEQNYYGHSPRYPGTPQPQ